VKLATFTHAGTTRIGVVDDRGIVDLSAAAPGLPRDMLGFLAAGSRAWREAAEALARSRVRTPLDEVRLEAPIPRPGKILACGLNYLDHLGETDGAEVPRPEYPVIFNKQTTAITAPGDPIHLPRISRALDYEGELAFVVGTRCRHVPRDRAAEVIAGYAIVNDVSVRDWQRRTPTVTMGKSFDTHCPFGPWIVTGDEVGDPHALDIRTWVNGELRQSSSTRHLLFDCFDLVAHLTTAFTLEPGDVVSTGTPAGVGVAMTPPSFLDVGDVVRVAIERIGALENRVIAEPEDTVRCGP
jgi:2-keto-4-pentenoate hydratase/2-oxohepta-3-ene-1,7-dioic acid hydratase in catechol pathway